MNYIYFLEEANLVEGCIQYFIIRFITNRISLSM